MRAVLFQLAILPHAKVDDNTEQDAATATLPPLVKIDRSAQIHQVLSL
jgi:hypothetical protein